MENSIFILNLIWGIKEHFFFHASNFEFMKRQEEPFITQKIFLRGGLFVKRIGIHYRA